MIDIEQVKKRIRKPDWIVAVEKKHATTHDIIKTIMFADQHQITAQDTADIAYLFEGPTTLDTCNNIWQFIHDEINYKRDKKGKELVKSPAVTLYQEYADCKSMTLLAASICKNLGLKYFYRFAGYHEDKFVTHVYLIVKNGHRNIIIDSTYDYFNEEVPYKFKKDKMPTTVSFIHKSANDVAAKRPAEYDKSELPKKRFIDFAQLTDGELTLQLIDRQLELLQATNPTHKSTYQKARNWIYNLTSKGLHGSINVGTFTGVIAPEIYPVAAAIKKARYRTKPAGKLLLSKKRTSIGQGIGIGDLVEVLDCQAMFPISLSNPNSVEQRADCISQNEYRRILNDYLEESSAHFLYEFISNPNAQPSTVATKAVLHKGAKDVLNGITELSQSNIRLWIRNGIMAANANEGIGALSPEEAIEGLKEHNDLPGIGIEPATVTLIIGILKFALSVTVTLIKAFKPTEEQQIRSALPTIGTNAFSSDTLDWRIPGTVPPNNPGPFPGPFPGPTPGSNNPLPGPTGNTIIDNTLGSMTTTEKILLGAGAVGAGYLLLNK